MTAEQPAAMFQRPLAEQVTANRHDINQMQTVVDYLMDWKKEMDRTSLQQLPYQLFGYPDRKDDFGVVGDIRASLSHLERTQDRIIADQQSQHDDSVAQQVKLATRINATLSAILVTMLGVIGDIVVHAVNIHVP